MGRMVTACCSIQASQTREREKFTVVPSSSWGSTVVGIGLVHSVGPPETVNLCLGGPYTREALLSEAGFEKVFRTQNWVRRSKQFCR